MGNATTSQPSCPFCLANNFFEGEIIGQTKHAYMARNSFSPGNYLIIPKAHIVDPTELPATWWQDMNELLPKAPELSQDYNLSLNIGRQAGQTVKHVCFWLIPRVAKTPASGRGLTALIAAINKA